VTSKYVTNILFAPQERRFVKGDKIFFSTTVVRPHRQCRNF
jgi:hypothetical protein